MIDKLLQMVHQKICKHPSIYIKKWEGLLRLDPTDHVWCCSECGKEWTSYLQETA